MSAAPIPWTVSPTPFWTEAEDGGHRWLQIVTPAGYTVALVQADEDDAEMAENAALVVAAVNSHAALVSALRRLIEHADREGGTMPKTKETKRREAAARLDAYAERIESGQHRNRRQSDMYRGGLPKDIAKAANLRRTRADNLRTLGHE